MSIIRIPTPLRAYTEGNKDVPIQAKTVESALQSLGEQYPSLTPHLYDEQGKLRPYINIFLNDENIRDLQGPSTSLREADNLMILPSIAGGR